MTGPVYQPGQFVPPVAIPPQPVQQPQANQPMPAQVLTDPVSGYPVGQIPPVPQQPQQQQQPQPQLNQFNQPVLQQPQVQQPQAQQPGENPAARIVAGPGVPQELVGRTYGEGLQIYAAMREQYMRGLQAQPQQVQPQTQQVQQPQTQQAPARQGADPSLQFWADPINTIRQVVRESAQETQAPALIQQAYSQVVGLPAFAELQPMIVQSMSKLTPQQQSDPASWHAAYRLALGDAVVNGRINPAQLQQAQAQAQTPRQQMPTQPSNGGWQPNAQPLPWAPAQQQGQFFTEQPGQYVASTGQSLSAAEEDIRQKMGMTRESYLAWKGGVAG